MATCMPNECCRWPTPLSGCWVSASLAIHAVGRGFGPSHDGSLIPVRTDQGFRSKQITDSGPTDLVVLVEPAETLLEVGAVGARDELDMEEVVDRPYGDADGMRLGPLLAPADTGTPLAFGSDRTLGSSTSRWDRCLRDTNRNMATTRPAAMPLSRMAAGPLGQVVLEDWRRTGSRGPPRTRCRRRGRVRRRTRRWRPGAPPGGTAAQR